MAVGGVEQTVTVPGGAPPVNTATSELSFLVGEQAIESLPLNGRNYTDLALLQPGVLAYPSRDGGSVVAHGLGMSVNGQDYRSNVYLLDGTLQNDFTNGPAGSAAGTALGMESIREFRVEIERLQRRVRPQLRRTDQRADQVGHQHAARQRLRVPPQRRARRRATTSTSPGKPDFTRNQFGGVARRTAASSDRLFYFVGYEGAARAPRQDDHQLRARRRRPRAASCPTARSTINAVVQPVPRRDSRAPTGRRSAAASRTHTLRRSTRRSTRTSSRAASTTRPARRTSSSRRYTLRRRRAAAADRLPAVPALVHLDEPVRHGGIPQRPLGPHAADGALRLQPHAHRPERRGQPRVAAAAVRGRPRPRRRHRHRRHAALRSAELGEPAARAERLQRPVRRHAHARPAPAEGRRARRALSRLHDQPDVQPRDLHVRERARVPREPRRCGSSA